MLDLFQRPLRDLRISVTDRCNFRCTYCMPRDVFGRDFAFTPRDEILSYEEIVRLAAAFVKTGVRRIRLTGGEPLLRRDLAGLVRMLARLEGLEDLALTTNGSLLTPGLARELASAGLRRITISLDAIDDAVFRSMADAAVPVRRVLEAIDNAAMAGLDPVKIDAVIRRGANESQIIPLAGHFRNTPHVLRFIEYMDVGTTNGWRREDVVEGAEILRILGARWPLEPLPALHPGETAQRFRYADGAGEIGVISSVSAPFCGSCNRARITADGQLYLCLFASAGHDLRGPLRAGADLASLTRLIAAIWGARNDRYSELRAEGSDAARVEMSRIGG